MNHSHAPEIRIKFIPHNRQAYPTVGDWRYKKGVLCIYVSQMSDWRYEVCVAVHELVEVILCRERGITVAEVDAFDKAYEKNRKAGDDSEPGDHPKAPYRREHFFATNMEALLSAELGIDWAKYEGEINSLP